jgi:hypothetical protein
LVVDDDNNNNNMEKKVEAAGTICCIDVLFQKLYPSQHHYSQRKWAPKPINDGSLDKV